MDPRAKKEKRRKHRKGKGNKSNIEKRPLSERKGIMPRVARSWKGKKGVRKKK